MRIASLGPPNQQMLTRNLSASAAHPTTAYAASLTVVLALGAVAFLVVVILLRALATIWRLLQPILALLGSMAISVVAVVLVLALVLSSASRHSAANRASVSQGGRLTQTPAAWPDLR